MAYNSKPIDISKNIGGPGVSEAIKSRIPHIEVYGGIAPFKDPTSYTGYLPGFVAEWRFEEKTGATVKNSYVGGNRRYQQTITGIPTRSSTGISYGSSIYSTSQFGGKPLKAFTVHCAFTYPAQTGSYVAHLVNPGNTFWCGATSTGQPQTLIAGRGVLPDNQTIINDGRYHVWSYSYDGITARLFVDGYPIATSNLAIGNAPDPIWYNLQIPDLGTLYTGKLNTVYHPSTAEIGFMSFFDVGHTVDQVKSYSNWIRARMIVRGAPMAKQNMVLFSGDSITAGVDATWPHYWREQGLNTLAANGILRPTCCQDAVPGTKTYEHFATANTPAASQAGALRYMARRAEMYQKGIGRNVLFIAFAENDLGSGESAAAIAADQAAMIAYERSIGADWVVVLTPYSNSTVAPSASQALADAINAGIGQDDTVDVWADPGMGGVGPSTDPTLYVAGLHPTSLGHDKLGVLVAPKMVAAFP